MTTLLFFFLNPLHSVSTALLLLFLLLWLKCMSFKTFQLPSIPPTRKNSKKTNPILCQVKKDLLFVHVQKKFQILLLSIIVTFIGNQSIFPKSVRNPWELTWTLDATPSPSSPGGFPTTRQLTLVQPSPSASFLHVFCQIWAYFHFSPQASKYLLSCKTANCS